MKETTEVTEEDLILCVKDTLCSPKEFPLLEIKAIERMNKIFKARLLNDVGIEFIPVQYREVERWDKEISLMRGHLPRQRRGRKGRDKDLSQISNISQSPCSLWLIFSQYQFCNGEVPYDDKVFGTCCLLNKECGRYKNYN